MLILSSSLFFRRRDIMPTRFIVIYDIEEGPYTTYGVEEVFDTREEAQEYVAWLKEDGYYNVNIELIEVKGE